MTLGVLLMMYVELVKRIDQDRLILVGYFTKIELKALKVEGYRQLPANKHGIRVA